MPLPLPNLDSRRWADMVEEGRSLIPRYAPNWTDHNVHDPGITLIELFAWLIEQDIYRLNQIPERHRRKFLALTGFTPLPPRPARVALTFTPNTDTDTNTDTYPLLVGTMLAASQGTTQKLQFRTVETLTITPLAIKAVQVFDGANFNNYTQQWQDGNAFPALGQNPEPSTSLNLEEHPAFYLGFDHLGSNQTFPVGEDISLWLQLVGERTDWAEKQRILNESKKAALACQDHKFKVSKMPPPNSDNWCPQEEIEESTNNTNEVAEVDLLPLHHSVSTVWEYHDGSSWQALNSDANEVLDETRSLTLAGKVKLNLPVPMVKMAIGTVTEEYYYIRCRLANGLPDYPPILDGVNLNTVVAEQISHAKASFTIAQGVTLPEESLEPEVGSWQNLYLKLNAGSQITDLKVGSGANGPKVLILNYEPAKENEEGSLEASLVLVGLSTGLPKQQVLLPNTPIAYGKAQTRRHT